MNTNVEHGSLKTKLAEMLTTSTGIHMLDSGMASGRAWQRNQAKVGDNDPVDVFEAEYESKWGWPTVYNRGLWKQGLGNIEPTHLPPAERLALHEQGRAELHPTHNVYHWLYETLNDYNVEMDAIFQQFADLPDNEYEGWLVLMETFPNYWAEHVARQEAVEEAKHHVEDDSDITDYDSVMDLIDGLTDSFMVKPSGLYGEGEESMIVNTYNGEDCLSQTLQYGYFEHNGESYVLLQIHGGADVRGGYTRPVAFDVDDMDMSILDNARGGCGCDKCDARWYTDDAGSHWYADNERPDLHELPARVGDFVTQGFLNAQSGLLMEGELPTIVIEEHGKYAETNIVRCPMCPTGTLEPYFY